MAAYIDWVHVLALEPDRDDQPHEDHFVVLHGVSWDDYERILEVRGAHSSPRISYLEGELQILSPSESHERIKSMIGRLVEVWCLEHDIEVMPYGSWTLSDKATKRGAEPDECYVLNPSRGVTRPHLALEVIWTSGGIDKLEIYRKLGVSEVWIWRRGTIAPWVLRGERYEAAARSEVLRGIDLRQLAAMLDHTSLNAAVKAWRELIRG